MDGDDFHICDERNDGQRDDCPASGIENKQRDKCGEQAKTVKFCEIGMRGRKFSEFKKADQNHNGFGKKNQCNQKIILLDDRFAQNPCDDEDEQIINHISDAVVTAKRGRGHAEFARENAVENV